MNTFSRLSISRRKGGNTKQAARQSVPSEATSGPADLAAIAFQQAQVDPNNLAPDGILALQRMIGNAATTRLLRPGAPGLPMSHARTTVEGDNTPRRTLPNLHVQRVDHATPASTPVVAGLMIDAAIADFGPYVWDDTVPRFKLNPAYAGWTFADCISGAVYEPEIKAVAGEKGNKHALMVNRVKAARQAIFGQTQGVIDAIIASGNGAAPRAFTTAAAEDALNLGAHIVQRHVLGQGVMAGRREVALRAAFWAVGGVAMDLDPAGISSVFASTNDADTSIAAAITGELTANWDTHRKALVKGNDIKMTIPIAGAAAAYRKHDAPYGAAYPGTEFPKYIDPTKAGTRVLFGGDYAGAGQPADPNAPDPALDPLTDDVSGLITSVYIIVKATAGAPGGWYVHTAYPKT